MKAFEVRPVHHYPGFQHWMVVVAEDDGEFVPVTGAPQYQGESEAIAEAARLGHVENARISGV